MCCKPGQSTPWKKQTSTRSYTKRFFGWLGVSSNLEQYVERVRHYDIRYRTQSEDPANMEDGDVDITVIDYQ